jgi:hypothetical protein
MADAGALCTILLGVHFDAWFFPSYVFVSFQCLDVTTLCCK